MCKHRPTKCKYTLLEGLVIWWCLRRRHRICCWANRRHQHRHNLDHLPLWTHGTPSTRTDKRWQIYQYKAWLGTRGNDRHTWCPDLVFDFDSKDDDFVRRLRCRNAVHERLHCCSVVWTGKEGGCRCTTSSNNKTRSVVMTMGRTIPGHHLKNHTHLRRNPMAGPIDRFNRFNLFWTRPKRSNVQDGIFNCWTICATTRRSPRLQFVDRSCVGVWLF